MGLFQTRSRKPRNRQEGHLILAGGPERALSCQELASLGVVARRIRPQPSRASLVPNLPPGKVFGTEVYRSSCSTDFDNSEIAGPVKLFCVLSFLSKLMLRQLRRIIRSGRTTVDGEAGKSGPGCTRNDVVGLVVVVVLVLVVVVVVAVAMMRVICEYEDKHQLEFSHRTNTWMLNRYKISLRRFLVFNSWLFL